MYTSVSSLQQALDRDTARRTMWAEARSLGAVGMQGVLWTALNRLKKPGWWSRQKGDGILDDTLQAVFREPVQFSCWNENDPNLPKLLSVDDSNDAFRLAGQVYDDVLSGRLLDITRGATLYHTIIKPKWADTWPPSWTCNPRHPVEECYRDMGHVFYRDV